MEHPKAIGDRSTLAVMLALQRSGVSLLLPFGENTRYDIVIEEQGRFARVQCKTGRLRNGAVVFAMCSSYAHHPNPGMVRRDYLGEVDYFAVFCPDNGSVYLIPVDDMPLRRQGALRVEEPRNNQSRRIRLASQYEVASFGSTASSRPRASSGARGSCA